MDTTRMTTEPANVTARRRRLQDWIDQRFGGVQSAFLEDIATRTGKPANQGELSGLLSGKKSFGEKKARKLEQQAGMPPSWLDGLAGNLDGNSQPPLTSQAIARTEIRPGYVRFPLLEGFAGMGRGDYIGDYPEVVEFVEVTKEWAAEALKRVPHGHVRVITGRGQSMRGTYNDGDLVFVDSRVKAFVDDAAYVFRYGGRVQIKRLQWLGGKLRIVSSNPEFPAVEVAPEELEIGGLAIAAWTLREF
jgi:phage repressor protein C with HTH and peptisase S24 domain